MLGKLRNDGTSQPRADASGSCRQSLTLVFRTLVSLTPYTTQWRSWLVTLDVFGKSESGHGERPAMTAGIHPHVVPRAAGSGRTGGG
jgi:hypothetical protein